MLPALGHERRGVVHVGERHPVAAPQEQNRSLAERAAEPVLEAPLRPVDGSRTDDRQLGSVKPCQQALLKELRPRVVVTAPGLRLERRGLVDQRSRPLLVEAVHREAAHVDQAPPPARLDDRRHEALGGGPRSWNTALQVAPPPTTRWWIASKPSSSSREAGRRPAEVRTEPGPGRLELRGRCAGGADHRRDLVPALGQVPHQAASRKPPAPVTSALKPRSGGREPRPPGGSWHPSRPPARADRPRPGPPRRRREAGARCPRSSRDAR